MVTSCLLLACALPQPAAGPGDWRVQPLASGTNASMRGVSVVDERVAWASGTAGTVLRTTDGGVSWRTVSVPAADSLDFRDIEAFDSLTAYVLSAGPDGRIYYTNDGGAVWTLQYRHVLEGAFFDCFDFYDRNAGLAMSDPVDGRYLLVATRDGRSWSERPASARPAALPGEAAFAASGTCLTIAGERAYIASGGGSQARVFWSDDRGQSWQPVNTPVAAGTSSAGIFALAFRDQNHGIAIGGDYQQPWQDAVAAVTSDGGRSWKPAGRTGYVSGAAWSASGASLIAVGPAGTRVSADQGLSWRVIDSVEYNAVQLANENIAFAVGPRGRIAKLVKD